MQYRITLDLFEICFQLVSASATIPFYSHSAGIPATESSKILRRPILSRRRRSKRTRFELTNHRKIRSFFLAFKM